MDNKALFSIENQIINHNFRIKKIDFLIWPIVRYEFLNHINNSKNQFSKPHASTPLLSFKRFKYVFDTLHYAPHKKNGTYDILFYTTARGRLNNRNLNRHSHYFSSITDKCLEIDRSFKGSYFIPDKTDNYATKEYDDLLAFLSYIKHILLSKKKDSGIENFIDFLKAGKYNRNKYIDHLKRKLYIFYIKYNAYKNYFLNVFKKLEPRVILLQTASYGGSYNAILLKTAKDNGIVTGEFQHGTISKGHLAYNYGEGVLKSDEYRKYFPDYVLTYGDYWNEQMNIPGETVTIGAPHFYHSIQKYKQVKEKKNTVLVVSQGSMTKSFVSIARYLAEKLPTYKIVFKLHPGEVPFEDRYKSLYKYNNVKVAKSGDIYKFIAECEHIVAHTSTTIFEAMGFNKKIYIIDDESSRIYIPKDVGIRFKENKELEELIKNNDKQESNYDLEYYFNSNWKENYEKFLSDIVGIK